ncbi:MAG: glycoside hydrolase domain-containing protein [Streptosporangiaceae bacterium]
MLADQLARIGRQAGAVAAGAALAAGALLAGSAVPARAGAAAPEMARTLKRVSYRGYTFTVPRSWPVIDEAGHPGHCVRFDEHAVYLGAPGINQVCPSWLVGTTEAVLIQPARGGSARRSVEDPTARVITVRDRRIRLTATFDTDPTVVYRILSSARLPAPVIEEPNPARLAAAYAPASRPGAAGGAADGQPRGAQTARRGAVTAVLTADRRPGTARAGGAAAGTATGRSRSGRPPRTTRTDLPTVVAAWHGLGFDSCAAPSAGYMRAWRRHSPYRAVGIYIGGADRACAQPNLTARWVASQARAGWHFIPLYVGPQAAYGEISSSASQGTRAAADAVVQAERLGLGPGTPLYYDMEAYPPSQSSQALRFLSAWTRELHQLSYLSGVYSSSQSGVSDLSRAYARHGYARPDAIFDALWNGRTNTADPAYRAGEWASHRRLHQYSGNVRQTFGGDSIDIDQDYLNVSLPWPGGTAQGTPALSRANGTVAVFYRGPGRHLWRDVHKAGSGWAHPVNMGGTLASAPSAADVGAGAVRVFYKGAGGYLYERAGGWSGGWRPPRRISMLGVIGSPPRAVAQSDGVVDVFWRGSADDHLWHGEYSPGHGWAGPQGLGGSLACGPAPAASADGRVAVFWRGTNGSLWQVTRGLGGSWTGPADLGMGPLGGSAYATAQPSGALQVVWRGSHPRSVWAAYRSASGRWTGPRDLGGSVTRTPWPVTAAGAVRVLWRGPHGGLWAVRRRHTGRFAAPVRLRRGSLRSAPFAAVGGPGGPLELFWAGRSGMLWSAAVRGGSTVGAHSLGSRMS